MLVTFGVVDYIVFALTLLLSAGIGVYFGCFGSKQKTTSEYLYGDGHMKAIPVGLSLYSSAVSAVTIIGTPAEVYLFGTQFLFVSVGAILSLFITWIFVLPVFCRDLGIKMPYEYFELRFDNRVRTVSSFIYIIHVILYMPVCLYSSTVAFSELSGLHLLICTTLVGGVCVLYTMIGGFQSVIWTDTLQATLMMASCFVVMVMGIIKVGGFDAMWTIAEKGHRIILFDMNPDPFARLTFWSASIGMGFIFASHSGCSASTLQRYMSLPGEKEGRISSFIGAFGFAVLTIITGFMGLTMYALYSDCDPMQHEVNGVKSNQLVPQFISDTIGGFPGFSGFFIAGLLSAGLSTLSAEFNTVAGLIYHDFIKKVYKKPISDAAGAKIMKLCVLVVGLLCLATVTLIRSKNIFQFGLMLGGLTYGAKLGILLLGTTFPSANATGALWGTAASFIVSAFLSFGAMYYQVNKPYELPLSTEKCPVDNSTMASIFNAMFSVADINSTFSVAEINSTTSIPESPEVHEEPFFLLKLSFMYYTLFGMIIAIVVGLVASYFSRNSNQQEKIDPKLIVPFMQKYIPVNQNDQMDQNGCVVQKMLSNTEKEDYA